MFCWCLKLCGTKMMSFSIIPLFIYIYLPLLRNYFTTRIFMAQIEWHFNRFLIDFWNRKINKYCEIFLKVRLKVLIEMEWTERISYNHRQVWEHTQEYLKQSSSACEICMTVWTYYLMEIINISSWTFSYIEHFPNVNFIASMNLSAVKTMVSSVCSYICLLML